MQPSTGRDRRHLHFRLLLALALTITSSTAFGQERPTIGVAFGGGSARGIAHVGVIRWFEEHRIPIDVAAGTSMGGLIGGSFATGMDAAAIQAMLQDIDWDQMFGFSNYAFKNIRRKADAQAYPSRLEFGVKRGIVLPPSLNSGHQVDLLITRITAAYYAEPTFATLPTPFKVVAVDLRTAEAVVLDRGSLARAMRATMSLPAVFPPVEIDGQVLVDGGAMNNVPADVVRAMGARTVIAINVGDLNDKEDINYSILGLAGATIDAMMRANTKKALAAADIVLTLPLVDFGSLDWRRSDALIEEGYKAAEAMRDVLLPHAVSEEEWRVWQARRTAARKSMLPQPTFVTLDGVGTGDERRINELLLKHVGRPIDVPRARTRPRRVVRPRPLRVHHVAFHHKRHRRRRTGRQRDREALRPAVPDARSQPREHHVRPIPTQPYGPLPAIRRARFRLGAAPRRHRRRGPGPGCRALPADLARAVRQSPRRRQQSHVQLD